jgi:hypothetical protein
MNHLVEQQQADGSWAEQEFYRHRFPVRLLFEVSPLTGTISAVRVAGIVTWPAGPRPLRTDGAAGRIDRQKV